MTTCHTLNETERKEVEILVIHVNIPELYGRQEWYISEANRAECGEMWLWIISSSDLLTRPSLIRPPGLWPKRLLSPLASLPWPASSTLFTSDKRKWLRTGRERLFLSYLCEHCKQLQRMYFVLELRVWGETVEKRCLVDWAWEGGGWEWVGELSR